MKFQKLFLHLALVVFVVARGANEKETETKQTRRRQTDFVSEEKLTAEKMARTRKPRYISRKKQEGVAGKETDLEWYFADSTHESNALLSPPLSGKRKRSSEPTWALGSRLDQTAEEKNTQEPMRREECVNIVRDPNNPCQLESIDELPGILDMSEEDMAHLLEEFDPSVEIDIEERTACENLQAIADETGYNRDVDCGFDAVPESRDSKSISTGEISSMKILSYSSPPLLNQPEIHPLVNTAFAESAREMENFQRADKFSYCDDQGAGDLREEKNINCAGSCDESQNYAEDFSCSVYFNPDMFSFSSNFFSSGSVSERNTLPTSSNEMLPRDEKISFLDDDEKCSHQMGFGDSQHVSGGFNNNTGSDETVSQRAYDKGTSTSLFVNEYDYRCASDTGYTTMPSLDASQMGYDYASATGYTTLPSLDASQMGYDYASATGYTTLPSLDAPQARYDYASATGYTNMPSLDASRVRTSHAKEEHYEFLYKSIKQVSPEKIKREIEDTLEKLSTTYKIDHLLYDDSLRFEIHIYNIARFCLFFNECELFDRYRTRKTRENYTSMCKDIKEDTEESLKLYKKFLLSHDYSKKNDLSPYHHEIFESLCPIHRYMMGINPLLDINVVLSNESFQKAHLPEPLLIEELSKDFEEIEMVINSINANIFSPKSFHESVEATFSRFFFQNFKNLHTICCFSDYDKITIPPEKIKALVEYLFKAFFRENRRLKNALLPEIASLEHCMRQKEYVIMISSIKQRLLMLYSLSCLNCFFSSLSESNLDEFFGNWKKKHQDVDSLYVFFFCVNFSW